MKVRLPSGRAVTLEAKGSEPAFTKEAGEPRFGEAKRAIAKVVAIDPEALSLADFHALRAILTKAGWLEEEPVEIRCKNCDASIEHSPCAALALGPFVDGELTDPELDVTLPFGVPQAIPPIRVLGAEPATDVIFAPRTVAEAGPLHAALARPELALSSDVVRAMGVVALGAEKRPPRLARALERASADAWSAVTAHFLGSHYPPRLFSIAPCSACGARNDVDAPYEREFSRDYERASNADPFVSFDEFDAEAQKEWQRARADVPASDVILVVDDGVPACDDGGEPLLGSYVPGSEGGMGSIASPPEISLFYRTFRAIHDEESPYDWRAELRETIEHELDHHLAGLEGDDPVDDEERLEIAREAVRIHGKSELVRRELRDFRADVRTFVKYAWPIILLIAIGFVIVVAIAMAENVR